MQSAVLEIGAGSGRLTIPLAQAGVSIVAVDISSSMLAILNRRLAEQPADVRQKIQIVEADVCELSLGERYDLIIVPFYTFNYFLTHKAQKTALERMHGHLSQSGQLLIDVFIPWSRIEYCSPEPVPKVDTIDQRTGNRVRGWNIYTIDQKAQMEHRRHHFEVVQPNGMAHKREFTVQRRYFFPSALEALFSNSGFSVEDVFTGYQREPPDANSEQLLYVLTPR